MELCHLFPTSSCRGLGTNLTSCFVFKILYVGSVSFLLYFNFSSLLAVRYFSFLNALLQSSPMPATTVLTNQHCSNQAHRHLKHCCSHTSHRSSGSPRGATFSPQRLSGNSRSNIHTDTGCCCCCCWCEQDG